MIGREDEVREYRDRVRFFSVALAIALMLILTRLFYLQVLKGDDLRKFSEANRLKKERLPPPRGIIFDRNGKVIVDNRAAFDVVLLSQYYTFKKVMDIKLQRALGLSPEELERKLSKVSRTPSFYPILLKADVDKDIIAAVEMEAEGFPGVDIEFTVQRRYPYGDLGAQLLGYIGEVDPKDIKNNPRKALQRGDYIGKMGVERIFDDYLRGEYGVGYVEVDAVGRRRKSETNERLLGFVAQTDPRPGDNLYLTIDADLEAAAGQAMKSRDFMGSVVALDPRSGEILALVNMPSYEPGSISGHEVNTKVWADLSTNKDRPLRNRALQDHYPPGSTFKLFLAIAGLAEGAITTKSSVNCHGHMQFGSRKFNCWKRHGSVEFFKSIQQSCDVFYYNLANQLGINTIAKYARMFGFGSHTGIKMGSESRGLIPDEEWKKKTYKDVWHPGETLSVGIGQGYVEVTPLQLAAAYAAIGNGGFLYKPYLVRRLEKRTGELIKEFQPELTRKIDIPSEVFDAVKEGLFEVVNTPGGTAYHSGRSKIAQISGKTGTAQVRAFADIMKTKCETMPRDYRHHGWFVGYAPRENPQIAVAAVTEHTCHGAAAGPVVREVIEAYLTKQAALAGQPLPQEPTVAPALPKRIAKAPKRKPEPVPLDTEERLVPSEGLVSPPVTPRPAETEPEATDGEGE